ncbi:MAG: hypothetical protein QXE01_12560 [Sulfolobales archaeon]
MKFNTNIDKLDDPEFFDWVIKKINEIPDAGQKEVMVLEDNNMLILKLRESNNTIVITNEKRKVIEIVTSCESIADCRDEIIAQIQKIKGDIQ